MRLLNWIVGLIGIAVVTLFAVSNRGMVAIGLWPFTDGLEIRIFLAVLLPFGLGFLCGWVSAGVRSFRRRRAAKKAQP